MHTPGSVAYTAMPRSVVPVLRTAVFPGCAICARVGVGWGVRREVVHTIVPATRADALANIQKPCVVNGHVCVP